LCQGEAGPAQRLEMPRPVQLSVSGYTVDHAKLFEWSDEITADCPRKLAKNLSDICDARCPDLPKVV
jgi:hypothetical protein